MQASEIHPAVNQVKQGGLRPLSWCLLPLLLCVQFAVFAQGPADDSAVTRAAVASAHPLATQAGIDIL